MLAASEEDSDISDTNDSDDDGYRALVHAALRSTHISDFRVFFSVELCSNFL